MNGVLGLAAAIVMSLTPSLMFLGLWYGLMYLRDDDLIERAREMEKQRAQYSSSARPTPSSSGHGAASETDGAVVCAVCGTRNADGVTYCRQCLATLDD